MKMHTVLIVIVSTLPLLVGCTTLGTQSFGTTLSDAKLIEQHNQAKDSAEVLIEDGRKEHRCADYQAAVASFQRAKDRLCSVSRPDADIQAKIDGVTLLLYNTYEYWGTALAQQANATGDLSLFEAAEDKYRQALVQLPGQAPVLKPKIRTLRREYANASFRNAFIAQP